MVNRSKIGYELEKKKRSAHEKPNMNEVLETLKAEQREKKLNFRRFYKHKTCSSIWTSLALSCFFLLIAGISTGVPFEIPDCGKNTYDTGNGVCGDCLAGLGDTCQACTARNYCSECKPGYLQKNNSAEATICVPCFTKHEETCAECT